MITIVIIGGGGHAKVLASALRSTGEFEIVGIVDPKIRPGECAFGIPVLGSDEILLDEKMRRHVLAIGVGSMRVGDERCKLYTRMKGWGYAFPPIVHRKAYVSEGVVLHEASQVMAGAVLQPDALLGLNVIVNTHAVIEHDCRIGDHAHICPGVVLGGNVTVGEMSFIGLGARVLPNVTIGKYVTVGAGAVVTKNLPDGVTAVGVPAVHQ